MSDYKVWDATVTFRADRGGDASGPMLIRIRWDSASDEVADLLVQLWRIHHHEVVKKAQAEGITLDLT